MLHRPWLQVRLAEGSVSPCAVGLSIQRDRGKGVIIAGKRVLVHGISSRSPPWRCSGFRFAGHFLGWRMER